MNPRGSTCWRKRWMKASAGSVSRFYPAPLRFLRRNVPCPSSSVSKRLLVRAMRAREGAQEASTSVPVPAGLQWVTHSTWARMGRTSAGLRMTGSFCHRGGLTKVRVVHSRLRVCS